MTPTTPAPVPNMAHSTNGNSGAVGIEIADSGTRLVAVLAEHCETPGRRWRRRLAAPPSPDEMLPILDDLIAEVLREGTGRAGHPGALGVALWGDVDAARGVTHALPQAAGWDKFPLAARLADRWGASVRLQSAVAAGGLAEATLGAGRLHHAVLYVHSARTIASAFVVGGEIAPGASGRGGRLAHWVIQPDGPRCACGIIGHLDPIASAQSIVRATIGLASGSDDSTAAMLRVSGGRAEAMTVRQVVQLASEGDPSAQTVLERAWDALALALANLVATLDPDIIVLGGPPAEAGEGFLAPLRDRLRLLLEPWRPMVTLAAGALEPHTTLTGACLLAQSE
jgi:glucokinase